MPTKVTPQTKNIYFTRSGQRIECVDKTWKETAEQPLDPPLSPYGFKQAHELGLHVAQLQPRITYIYASPVLRTLQTALQVAKELNKNVSLPSEITKIRPEPGYGKFLSIDVKRNEKDLYRPLHQIPEISQDIEYFDQNYISIIKADYHLRTGAESRQQLRNRLRRVLQCTLNAHTVDCNILIVTHAAVLIEGVRALTIIHREPSQKMIETEKVETTTTQEENNISAWDMSPIRAGVCSLTHLELTADCWTLSKNGFTSYLSKGEQNTWIFSDDASLYEISK